MSDLISREEALNCFPLIMQGELFTVETIRHQLKKLPPVESQEWISIAEAYKHGKWIDTEPDKDRWGKSNAPWKCSCCGHRAGKDKYKTYKFCPWCGAKMDKGEETQRPYKDYQDLRTGEYERDYLDKGEE